ncbi:hypothetical protein [Glaciihabitans sp. UYNi722]|uniref:hypothetical protein n=1 Tax=Glaciihabitans sp. UYNi722 TaxID=3156344 RepID=UPI0033921B12
MPRSNRPRGRAGGEPDDEEFDLSRVLYGSLRSESKRNGRWNVQPVSAVSAAKFYTCPGCGLEISPGTSHLVAWRADGLMGEAEDLAARRHWHSHCWKIT